jgi:hypothetical protein
MSFKLALYSLAILTSFACMLLLFRGYAQSGMRLLLWSALCFVGLTVNNVLLLLDAEIFTAIDLRPYRLSAALIGMGFLIYGFIWETE